MKKILQLLIATYISFAMVGCYEDSVGPEVPVIGSLTLSQEQMSVSAEGGEYSVDIYTEYAYQASTNVDWIEFAGGSCSPDYCTQYFNVKANNTDSSREGVITIFCDDYNLSATLTISQEANTLYAISLKTSPLSSTPIVISAIWNNVAYDGKDFYEEYFSNAKFIYDETNCLYSGEPARYWPLSGTMQYMAFAPYTTHTTTTNHYKSDGSFGKIDYEIIDNNIVDQHDILYSNLLEVSSPQTHFQSLIFHHALAQINVSFTKTESAASIVVNKVMILNAHLDGILEVTPAPGGKSVAEWQTNSPYSRYFLHENATSIEDVTLNAALDSNTTYSPKPIYVIPSEQTQIRIVCIIDNIERIRDVDLSFYGKWEMGKKYNYDFTIDANTISLGCTAEDWDAETADGPTIVI